MFRDKNMKSSMSSSLCPVFPVCAGLLVFGKQYNEAEDEPKNQEVRGHQQEGHWVQVPSGSFRGQTLREPGALEARGALRRL